MYEVAVCDTNIRTEENTLYRGYNRENFAASDRTIPFRIVGSYEYFRAVFRLDRLASISTADEIAVYDRIIGQRDEYSYYAGMSTQSMLADSIDPAERSGREKFDSLFRRSGLAWMLALARIELTATVAFYGDHRIKQPFSIFPPTALDQEAFLLVLADDLQAHLTNLASDPGYAEVTKLRRMPDSWTLAYMRRMHFLNSMIEILSAACGPEMATRLQPHRERLAADYRKMQKMIEKVNTPVLIGNSTTRQSEIAMTRQYIDEPCPPTRAETTSSEVRGLFSSGSPLQDYRK